MSGLPYSHGHIGLAALASHRINVNLTEALNASGQVPRKDSLHAIAAHLESAKASTIRTLEQIVKAEQLLEYEKKKAKV